MTNGLEIGRANTILYCTSWTQTVGYYRNTLGLPVSYENDWFVEFGLGHGSHVSIANADRATVAAAGGAGITLSWQVADIEQAHHAMLERGARPGALHHRWGVTAFHLHDPDDHRIELWASPDQS